MNTITEFCCAVDQATDDQKLEDLWVWLRSNGRKFSLAHLRFMVEHLNTKRGRS